MKRQACRAACAVLVMLLAACSSQPVRDTEAEPAPNTPPPVDPMVQAMTAQLAALPDTTVGTAVADFYGARDDRPAWFGPDRAPRAAIKSLLDALSRADRQGLIAADYGYDRLAERIETLDAAPGPLQPADLAKLDIRLSRAFVAYAVDLHRGRIEPGRDLRPRWYEDLPPGDYAGALARATDDGNVDDALAELRPPHAGYTLLVKALADYRAIVDDGGWPMLADGPLLESGMRDARVPALRRRLHVTGDLPPDSPAGDTVDDGVPRLERLDDKPPVDLTSRRYDQQLAAAVRHFQRRHGLAVDGRVGPSTRAALNVPAERRAHQIELNLERWRWLPGDLGDRYVMVNIPEYRLRAYDDGQAVLEMNVVVGKSYDDRATPVFSDRMRYVIFRPFWNIPHGIAVDEILPKARADAGYLDRRQYQIVRAFGPNAEPLAATPANLDRVESGQLHMRQAAGPHNALGLVKFMFPNEYAVYLHDSPSEQLFSRTQRDFSHGCVRVADPAALAGFVLAGRPEWDAARIDKALHEGGRERVNLAEPLPVYLIYWTAFVNDDGVQFRNDLYNHDPQLERAMQRSHRTSRWQDAG
ncbi:L,D-transpeptidase family protein [Salinisphaera sp. T31B1]|uniref:L,D-transpeptidase family protein n=1 Tax=Salinisphaera sp. T31B1 TaxID=727963 RepID=UPI00333E55F6